MKKITCLFALLMAGYNLLAQINNQHNTASVHLEQAQVIFTIKNFGLKTSGSLSGLEGDIYFDVNNIGASSFDVTLKSNTINTNNRSRDKHLRSDDYFDVDRYPQISFRSTEISKSEDGYEAEGKLTIKSVTRNVTVPFSYQLNGNIGEFVGTLKINRLDYNVGKSSWTLSDNVDIKIKAAVK